MEVTVLARDHSGAVLPFPDALLRLPRLRALSLQIPCTVRSLSLDSTAFRRCSLNACVDMYIYSNGWRHVNICLLTTFLFARVILCCLNGLGMCCTYSQWWLSEFVDGDYSGCRAIPQ